MDENKNMNPGEQRSEEPATEPQQPAQPQPAQPAQPQQPQQNYGGYGQQTPPPQYAQRSQYGYQPQPQPQQYAYVPAQPANRGKGGGWISFLRVMAWILFAVMELTFIFAGVMMIAQSSNTYFRDDMPILNGLLVIVVGTLMSFLMVAAMNVALDAAQNIRRTATNTAEMNEKLANIERKLK